MNTLTYRAFANELELIKLGQLEKDAFGASLLAAGKRLSTGALSAGKSLLGGGRQSAKKFFVGRAPTVAAPSPMAGAAAPTVPIGAASGQQAASQMGRVGPARPTVPVQTLSPMQQRAEQMEAAFSSPAMKAERIAGDKALDAMDAARRAIPSPRPNIASQRSWKKQSFRPGMMTPVQMQQVQQFRAGLRPS